MTQMASNRNDSEAKRPNRSSTSLESCHKVFWIPFEAYILRSDNADIASL